MKRSMLIAGAAIVFCTAVLAAKSHAPKVEAQNIRETVKYLSSDALEGRGTGQKGGDAAADYIAAQFKQFGLKPAGANGTYFQDVPIVGVTTLPATNFSFVPASGAGAPVDLKMYDDYVTNN